MFVNVFNGLITKVVLSLMIDTASEVQGALDFSRLLPKGRKNAVWQARLANAEPPPSLVPASS